jgi:hypothetical protein
MELTSKDKILLEMLMSRFKQKKFTFISQNILKSDRFFHLMVELERDEYLSILHRNHKTTFYELTDKGEAYADLIANDFIVPDRLKRIRRGMRDWSWVKPW